MRCRQIPGLLPPQHQRYFARYVDDRTLPEHTLNRVRMTTRDYGRGFALIAGISKYPNIKGNGGRLSPSAGDVHKLLHHLTTYETVCEIVVLQHVDAMLSH